jgi:hypothetical protein
MDLAAPISRRSVLLFGTGIAWGVGRQIHLSLLPLYIKEYNPVSSGFLTAARTALEKTYPVVPAACQPEFYNGGDEANGLLEYLSSGKEESWAS